MFTRKFIIPEYNWNIEMYDLTVGEEKEIPEAFDNKDPSFPERLVKLIVKWDCTDRNGAVLPVTAESVSKLPRRVVFSLLKLLLKSGYQELDSKNTSAS